MRNMIKLVDIITLAVVIGFMAGCENPTGSTHAHQWGNWRQTRAPTCTTAGEETRTCTLDATHVEIQAIPIDPNAHNYGNWAETTAPSCTTSGEESGTCAYDNSHTTTRAIAALGHDYQSWAQTTAPTCTTDGEETGTCTRDATHTTTRPKAINPNAHDWNIEKEVIAAATETTDGKKAITCKHNSSHTKDEEFSGEYATGTVGLAFELINDNNAYRVSKGSISNGIVHIPAYHRPDANSVYLPIMEIGNVSSSSGDDGAFSNTNITNITIPTSVITIGGWAFYNCKSLIDITITASITSIGNYAFYQCSSLTSVTIPASVTFIGNYAFNTAEWNNPNSLTSINVDSDNPNYASQDGILYNEAKTTLIQAPGRIIGNITLPTGLMSISESAFYGCKGLTSITIPASLTSIEYGAFAYCTSIISITIPAGVFIGAQVFSGWISSQTINIESHASQATADAVWDTYWKYNCDAVINYLGQ